MAQNPIRTAAAAESGLVTGTLLEALIKRFGYVLNVGESLSGLEFDVGDPHLLVFSAATGYAYFYDSTDSTTADDGRTCLVTGNGLRYHIEDSASISLNSVLSFETAPPSSPVVGDAHIVNPAATGAFSGHDDDIALYTRRGWVYATPEVGLTVLNEDDDANWQYTASGWTGFAVAFADGSILPPALAWPAGLAVESTENTPPGSPTVGPYWIVGTVPTGAYVGHGGDLAHWTGSAWAFIDAYEGATVFHKDFGFSVSYISGSWLGQAGSEVQEFTTAGSFSWTKPSKGTMALIEVWGAGGGGGRGGTVPRAGGGGGGGAYTRIFKPLSSLSASETVTVGAGGAAVTSPSTAGNAGANSSFGSHLTAYGGGAGGGGPSSDNGSGGGGGGGVRGVGGNGSANNTAGTGGLGLAAAAAETNAIEGGGGGGGTGGGGVSGPGGAGANGGGGGGGGGKTTGTAGVNTGGKAIDGGGGGGGGNDDAAAGAGGTSARSGAGGAGASGSSAATAGTAPAGGGGGAGLGTSGKGGDGMVRITVF